MWSNEKHWVLLLLPSVLAMPVLTLDIPTWLIRFSCSAFTSTAIFMLHRVCTAIYHQWQQQKESEEPVVIFSAFTLYQNSSSFTLIKEYEINKTCVSSPVYNPVLSVLSTSHAVTPPTPAHTQSFLGFRTRKGREGWWPSSRPESSRGHDTTPTRPET